MPYVRKQKNYKIGANCPYFSVQGESMNLLNDLILMIAGFDLFVMYLVYKAVSFYRNN